MSERHRRWWLPALLCFGVAGALFLRGFTWQLHVADVEGLHLTPLALRRVRAFAIAMPTLPGLGLLVLALAQRIEWRAVVSLVATLVLALVGAGALMVEKFELFHDEETVRSERSHDGRREAHVFRISGLFSCEHVLYLSEPGAVYGEAAGEGTKRDCSDPGVPGVRWLHDGGVELTMDGGKAPEPVHLFPAWN